jgi:hypothetical protein
VFHVGGAQQMAVMLANAIEQTPTEEQRPEHRFWKTMGTKFLAPMLFAAAVKGLGMADVLHWLDSREDQQIKHILNAAGVPAALDAWESSQYRTDRAVASPGGRQAPLRGSRWTPIAASTWLGASLAHSPIAARDLASASTAATATASTAPSACRRPRRWRGSAIWAR